MITLSEHQMQKSVIAECNMRANQDPRWGRIAAVPNGGQRDVRVAVKLKAEGVRPGFPDLILALPSRGYHGMVCELKVGKNKPTPAQVDWLEWFRQQGWYAVVVTDDPGAAMEHFAWYLSGAE